MMSFCVIVVFLMKPSHSGNSQYDKENYRKGDRTTIVPANKDGSQKQEDYEEEQNKALHKLNFLCSKMSPLTLSL